METAMKLKNDYPWLKSRVCSTPLLNSQDLHEDTDLARLDRLAQRMKRSVLRRLAQPIEVVESNTRCHEIAFLRMITADTEPGGIPRFSGFMVRRLMTTNNGSIRMGFDPYPEIFSLDQAIDFRYFSERFADLWVLAIPSLLLDVPKDAWSWAHYQVKNWLGEFIHRLLRQTLRLGIINRRFSHAMNLNRRLVFISRHLSGFERESSPTSYEVTRASYDWLAKVQKDAENLLWLAHYFTDQPVLDSTLEPVAAIRKWLIEQGLSPKGWRLLVKSSSGYWAYLRMFYGYEPPLQFMKQIVSWIRRHEDNGLMSLLPQGFAGVIFDAEERMADAVNSQATLALLPDATFKLLAKKAIQAEADGTLDEWLADDLPRFQVWIADHPGFTADKNQLKAGWDWLAPKMARWAEAVEKGSVKSIHRWEFALDHHADDHFEAIALATNKALWEEGEHMCHCVGGLGKYSSRGTARYFSIRYISNQERLATLEIAHAANDPIWLANRCHGRHNAPPGSEVIAFAIDVARAYNLASEQLPRNQELTAEGFSVNYRKRLVEVQQDPQPELGEAA